jgi:hypothetical protein
VCLVVDAEAEIMKTIMLVIAAAILLLLVTSCDDNKATVRNAVQQAYQQGAADAIREVHNKVEQGKQQLMGEIQPKLLIGAIIVLLITFFGDTIAEKLREQLVTEFQLTPEKQSVLLSCGFLLLCSIIGIWSLNRCTSAWSLPIMLLLSGASAVFFFSYIPTLFGTEREVRRLAMTRIKLLMFAAGVILAVHELLASDGILKLPM